MVTGWRLVRPAHAQEAFSGRGARLYGGRWNSPGVAVVYGSSTLSLAVLELLVHVPASLTPPDCVHIEFHFEEALVEKVESSTLPANWRDYPAPPELQAIGDAWMANRSSAVLQVPSAVIPLEFNYLLNPDHPDFRSVDIGQPRDFRLDYRLLT